MSLTQAVSYIDREQLGLFYISCPLLLRFRGPRLVNTSPSTLWITTSTLSSMSPQVLYVKFILKTESQNVWFGSISENGWQELLQKFPRFGLVFSLRSQQGSWGVLINTFIKIWSPPGEVKKVFSCDRHSTDKRRLAQFPQLVHQVPGK